MYSFMFYNENLKKKYLTYIIVFEDIKTHLKMPAHYYDIYHIEII